MTVEYYMNRISLSDPSDIRAVVKILNEATSDEDITVADIVALNDHYDVLYYEHLETKQNIN
jgi:hypothetical protein